MSKNSEYDKNYDENEEESDLINDFDAPEGCDFVEIQIEQLKCGDKNYIRQLKKYTLFDGSISYVVKIDGIEKF